MAENQKRSAARRQLAFEPLESRSLLSVIAVAAPGPRPPLPPAAWPAQQTEAALSLQAGQNVVRAAETATAHQPVSLGTLDSPSLPLATASPEKTLSLEDEAINLLASSLSEQVPARDLPPLAGRNDAFDDPTQLATPGSLDTHDKSEARAPVLDMTLSVDVVFIRESPVFAHDGDPPTGHFIVSSSPWAPIRTAGFGGDALHGTASPGGRSDLSASPGGNNAATAASPSSESTILLPSNLGNDNGPPASRSGLNFSAIASSSGSLPSDLSAAAEGGYVEIDNAPLPPGPLEASKTPAWNLDEGNPSDPGTYAQKEDVTRDFTIGNDNGGPTGVPSDGADHAELADGNTALPMGAAEGGMVELAAAAPQDMQPVSTKLPRYGDPLPNMKEIELDNGLGLFHAFELATSPLQSGDQARNGSEKIGKADMPPAADVAPLPAPPSTMRQSTATDNDSGKQVVFRSAAFSTVFVAAMFVPISSLLRKTRSRDDGRPSRRLG